MKSRPTIALAMIVKNEAHNLGPLLNSVKDCFDEIHITDTGSTDNTVEILQNNKTKEIAGCPIFVHHFEWINDFAKARQYSFDQVPEYLDYIMWLDGDDILSDKEAFIHFRDHTLHTGHQWLVNYNYAYEGDMPICTFFRERIIKNNYGFTWKYFVHEGLIPPRDKKIDTQFIGTFTINHIRTDDDLNADRSRNIELFEKHLSKGESLEPRMLYYYGKELFDAGQYLKSTKVLKSVCETPADEPLELHDRIMAVQYLAMAYAQCGRWQESLHMAVNGLSLAPDRAEFWICIADGQMNLGKPQAAKLFYEGAKHCTGGTANGAIYTSPHANAIYPAHQLAQMYLNEMNWNAAQGQVEILKRFNHPAAPILESKIIEMKQKDVVPTIDDLIECDDIVISTPPGTVTNNWDENVLKTKGLGGSETACVEIARLLKKKTGRPVKIFMQRDTIDEMESGVEYLPISHLEAYFRKYKPFRHIAWRHASRLTPAPSYVWSHDLLTPGSNRIENYEKLWCLTEFHKNFVMDMMKVPEEKIDLVHNGIDPELFKKDKPPRNPYKVIFSSSPDRGWERCVEICKRAKEQIPELELHLFYGTMNMRKMGMEDEANRLDALVNKNDFVHFHGFVNKQNLIQHFQESAVWLYPADFIETSCITAMEAICAGAFPLVRNMGALKYTLGQAYKDGMCEILDKDPCDDASYGLWAAHLTKHLREKSWEKVDVNIDDYSWETRLNDYLLSMGI